MMTRGTWLSLIAATALLPSWIAASEKTSASEAEAKGKTHRWREGEVIELDGRLELSGDRAIFYPPEGEPLRVLENLALERITRVLTESPGERTWLVSGVITEYRGSNYLLLSKAMRRALKEKPTKP